MVQEFAEESGGGEVARGVEIRKLKALAACDDHAQSGARGEDEIKRRRGHDVSCPYLSQSMLIDQGWAVLP